MDVTTELQKAREKVAALEECERLQAEEQRLSSELATVKESLSSVRRSLSVEHASASAPYPTPAQDVQPTKSK